MKCVLLSSRTFSCLLEVIFKAHTMLPNKTIFLISSLSEFTTCRSRFLGENGEMLYYKGHIRKVSTILSDEYEEQFKLMY